MSDHKTTFFVPTRPVSKLRPIAGKNKTMRTPPRMKEWKARVAFIAEQSITQKYDGDVLLKLLFIFDDGRWVGDIDNLAGGIMDALNGVDVVTKKAVELPTRGKLLRGQKIKGCGCIWVDDRKVMSMDADKIILNTLTDEERLQKPFCLLKCGVIVEVSPLTREEHHERVKSFVLSVL